MVWAAAVLMACALPSPPAPPDPPGGPPVAPTQGGPIALTGNEATDRAPIARLEQEARALARPDGCADGGACRAVPLGAKACGGPRAWLPYCPASTDLPALQAKLAELEVVEQALNRRYNIASDCSYLAEPRLEAVGGSCRAAPAGLTP